MKSQRITFEVSEEEFGQVEGLRGSRTWRELFLTALGISTERRKCGPPRGGERSGGES